MGDIKAIVVLFSIGLIVLGACIFCTVMRRRERDEIAVMMAQTEYPSVQMLRGLAIEAIKNLKEDDPEGKIIIEVYQVDSNPERLVLVVKNEHDAPTVNPELKGKFILAATARDCKEKAERLRKAAS